MLVKTSHTVRIDFKKNIYIYNVQTCKRIHPDFEVVLKASFVDPLYRDVIVLFHRSGDHRTNPARSILLSPTFWRRKDIS